MTMQEFCHAIIQLLDFRYLSFLNSRLSHISKFLVYTMSPCWFHVLFISLHALNSLHPTFILILFVFLSKRWTLVGEFYNLFYVSIEFLLIIELQVIQEFEPKERYMLLKFVTSCSWAPLLGFKHLLPTFTIHKV